MYLIPGVSSTSVSSGNSGSQSSRMNAAFAGALIGQDAPPLSAAASGSRTIRGSSAAPSLTARWNGIAPTAKGNPDTTLATSARGAAKLSFPANRPFTLLLIPWNHACSNPFRHFASSSGLEGCSRATQRKLALYPSSTFEYVWKNS